MSDDMTEAMVRWAIKRARKLLERGWCQHALAKTADGEPCVVTDPQAAQFCLSGGLQRAAYELCEGNQVSSEWLYRFARRRVADSLPRRGPSWQRHSIGLYNDLRGRRLSTVLRRLDIAAGAGKERG